MIEVCPKIERFHSERKRRDRVVVHLNAPTNMVLTYLSGVDVGLHEDRAFFQVRFLVRLSFFFAATARDFFYLFSCIPMLVPYLI